MTRLLGRLWGRMDKRVERLVLKTPTGRAALAWQAAIVVGLLVATAARAAIGPYPLVDLFMLPVLTSCFVFRYRGLFVLPVALLGFHIATALHGQLPRPLLIGSDVLQLTEWGLLSAFVLITLDRYAKVKGLQARMTQDLEMARTLQSALIQPAYDFGKLRIEGSIHQSHDVGGDFYYFRPFMQKYVVFCLGDVMGKGISASLLMALVMGFMFEWGKKSPSPGFVLRKLNHRLIKLWEGSDSSQFITMIYAVFDEESMTLTYSGAGHHNGIILRAGAAVEMIQTEGLPLGVMDDIDFPEGQIQLATGDRVVFYTDGISEARRKGDDDLYGLERLLRVLQQYRQAELPRVLEEIERSVLEHTQGDYSDDMAVLMAEVKA